jgi:signal transduction histidine kinase
VTLKVRLAAMMIVLLGAVMAAQYLLLQREQQVLAARLDTLTEQIDASTRLLTERTRAHVAPFAMRTASGRFGADEDSVSVVVMVQEDSTVTTADGDTVRAGAMLRRHWTSRRPVTLLEMEAELDRLTGRLREEQVFVSDSADTVRVRGETHVLEACGDSSTIRLVFSGSASADSGAAMELLRAEEHFPGALRVNLPFFPRQGGPRHVELFYSTEEITGELERARRRSYLWLTGLLGVGATAAVAVAFQFTRPIRSLQESFRRVQEGDLNVALTPERPDEIGKLTGSFNAMVVRLRESRDMEHRLAESERLAAVGTLAAGVAHEVRNPLNAMLLTLEQLRAKTAPAPGTPERERFDRYVESVTGELRRLERLVGTFLDLSRAEQLGREPVNVADGVRGAAELFRDEARDRNVSLTVEAPDPVVIRGDGERLRTVWNNLITNALQATKGSGTVRVRVVGDADGAVVEVTDDGEGIAPEALGKIWEPFYSGRPGGTGLGLALVRSIVEKHGGTIDVDSRPGAGTTFRVILPAGGAAPGEANA